MIRHALRTIGRMPGLAAVVILSLGVGIGVNTTVFSWIQAMLLHPIPGVAGSSSFYNIEPKSDTGTYPGMSWTEYQDLKHRTEPDRTGRFYRYWVAKEAVLKGQGVGIGSLHQCEILPAGCDPLSSATVSCVDPSGLQSGWTIQWLNCGPGWQGAVSADGSDWTIRIRNGENP